jgi:copper(I)-binding protein
VTLSPRTPLHLMLMDLKRQLKEGDKFPLTLTFEKSGSVTVTVLVGKAGAMGPDMDPHANHQR